jgi:hypothetical protein
MSSGFECLNADTTASYSAVFPSALVAWQCSAELVFIAREGRPAGQAHRDALVEIHDKELVLRVAQLGKLLRGLHHLRSFPSHAAAVVDNEVNGSRNIFGTDELNRLFLSVFESLMFPLDSPFTGRAFESRTATLKTTRSTSMEICCSCWCSPVFYFTRRVI